MAQQQLAAKLWGGMTNLPSTPTPGPALWQYGGKVPGNVAVRPPASGAPPSNVAALMQQFLGMYPDRADTPQPLPGGYGSQAWNILDQLGGASAQAPATGQAGQAPIGQISTGITAPNIPDAPTRPTMPGLPSWVNPQAAQANWPQSVEPGFMELLASYYPSQAGLQSGFEGARANAGLGWGGLRTGLMGNLAQMLGRFL